MLDRFSRTIISGHDNLYCEGVCTIEYTLFFRGVKVFVNEPASKIHL